MQEFVSQLNHITRNNGRVDGKNCVYFTCHKNDKDTYLTCISNDIFETQDCVIYYTDDMDASYTEEIKEDLKRMNLFVIPITKSLLFSECRTISEDVPFCKQNDIPILPLMMDDNLSICFEQIFGKIHYLVPGKHDSTAIPYSRKLKQYLSNTLLSNEMRTRIQQSYDEYIFLSYRKKDRKYANELMRLMHVNPRFRRIAIWYDEYLVPGEKYSDAIKLAMEKSSEFMLLVTPNLLEDNNYVLTTEYPYAKKIFEKVLPVEMVLTNQRLLQEKYEGVTDIISGYDEQALEKILMESIKRIAGKENKDNPIHNYLLGLAYLEGIDVEINKSYAFTYIESAANGNLPEAVAKLAWLYHEGIGVERDLYQCRMLMEKNNKLLREAKADEKFIFESYQELAKLYDEMALFSESFECWYELYEWQKRVLLEDSRELMFTAGKVANAYQNIGNIEAAKQINTELLEKQTRICGDKSVETLLTMDRLSRNYLYLGEYSKALELVLEAVKSLREILGDENATVMEVRTHFYDVHFYDGHYFYLSCMYNERYQELKNYYGDDYPLTLCVKAKYLLCKFFDEHDEFILFDELSDIIHQIENTYGNILHPSIAELEYLTGIALCYLSYELGERLIRSALKKRENIYGKEHPETRIVYKTLEGLNKILCGNEKFSFDLLLVNYNN